MRHWERSSDPLGKHREAVVRRSRHLILYKDTVLCDVYFLRSKGAKLPRDRLVATRGQLRVSPGGVIVGLRDVPPYKSTVATLHRNWPPNFPGQAAATLHEVRLLKMDERGFVLAGTEVVHDGIGADTCRQAWFCRPVAASEASRYREPAWARDSAPGGARE